MDFLALDGRGSPSARPGDRQGRRHSGATADGPDSVRLGVFEDIASGQCAPPRETWNQGRRYKIPALSLRVPVTPGKVFSLCLPVEWGR